VVLLILVAPAQAGASGPAPGPTQVIAGPAAGVSSLGGISIARDGTGAVVYLAQSGGVAHVFVSRLVGGVFQTAQRVDTGLSGASSQPVVAAGNGGLVLVAFINAGSLYAADAPSAGAAWRAPSHLEAGAENPSLQMNRFGKAYLAFTGADGTGNDVRVEYFAAGAWAPASAPLNLTPADDAGTGAGRPVVATSGDGIGIVAWGERGHLYARRVWGTSPSVADQQLDPPSFAGGAETWAGDPAISVGGNSSYVDVAYEETLQFGGQPQTRVLMTRLISADTAPAVAVDGLSAGGDGDAASPAVAMGEYGQGFITATNTVSNHVLATPLGSNGVPGALIQPDSGSSTAPPLAVPAVAGPNSALIAWQQTPLPGQAEIFVRVADGGSALGSPIVLAPAGSGSPQAGSGLAADGDNSVEAAIAWAQGTPGVLSIDVAQLYQPPGAPRPSTRLAYTRNPQPTLTWGQARARWGPVTYTVKLDGRPVAQTTATSYAVSGPLGDGPHVWQVQATNPAGQHSTSAASTVFVDTVAPLVRIRLNGRLRARRRLTLHVAAVDAPPPEPGARASGIARVTVSWGRRLPVRRGAVIRRASHAYARPGLYRIRVTATDRAGNVTAVSRYVRILK
jgi:hypothetical protein